MRYHTHIVTSCIAGITVANTLDIQLSAPLIAGLIIGSLFPDIDEPNSYVGRRSLGTSHIINFLFGHRGITHSLLPVAILMFLSFKFSNPLLIGFTAGYLFHILGDVFSKSGVPLLLPFKSTKYAIPIYTTGGIIEHIIFIVSLMYLLKITGIFNIMNFL